MANESYSEQLVEVEMKVRKGENSFGFVFPQGDIQGIEKIENLLKKAGGKPDLCELPDFSKGGNGKAKPEYIVTFNNDTHTILVVECKRSATQHSSEELNKPKKFAVDGALYYAKFLKEEYNVVAIAVSGTKKDDCKVSTFYWQKGFEKYTELNKAHGIILEPVNYLKLIKGERIQKKYSLEEIRETALNMHDALREIKMSERSKPIFIAGILIGLQDADFEKEYINCVSFNSAISRLTAAIENVLQRNNVNKESIDNIVQIFKNIGPNPKFKDIPLTNTNSILWYIEQLEMKIKPMMTHADVTLDALGIFYHEFVKYTGGDGKGLGIVLTPQHLTEFMVELAGVNKNSRVVDICAGSGSFLVSAMSKMFQEANEEEIYRIRQQGLYGVELDDELYTLCIANMIVRKDGKSNIFHNDCFNPEIKRILKEKQLTVGLINPPYSQKDHEELEFVECLLDVLSPQGTAVVVVPMSCALGTKFQETRERLFKKHTLKAVFSMPDDIFYSNSASTVVCVMVWEAYRPHDSKQETFFGYYKDDGFVKRKKLGRIDVLNKWETIKDEWLSLYRNRDVKNGLSARHCVTYKDEWCVEAYMETDYSKLNQADFEKKIKEYIAFEFLNNSNIKSITLPQIEWPDIKNLGLVELSNIFDIKNSQSLELLNCEQTENGVWFVSRTSKNNGIAARVEQLKDLEPMPAGAITVALSGSVLSSFYQGEPFYTAYHIASLYPKQAMIKEEMIYYAYVIEQNKYRYSFGRQANKTLKNILVPRIK